MHAERCRLVLAGTRHAARSVGSRLPPCAEGGAHHCRYERQAADRSGAHRRSADVTVAGSTARLRGSAERVRYCRPLGRGTPIAISRRRVMGEDEVACSTARCGPIRKGAADPGTEVPAVLNSDRRVIGSKRLAGSCLRNSLVLEKRVHGVASHQIKIR